MKVLDFGLAKPIDAEIELTKCGAVVGTPAFMSPEQARGEKVDHRTDLFSLGAVMYKLCTGRLPFNGPTTMAVHMALGTQEPQPVRELNPAVPESLANLIHQLLSKNAATRPESASELVKQLRAIAENGAASRNRSAEQVPSQPQLMPPNVVYVPMSVTAMPEANPFADIDVSDSELLEPTSPGTRTVSKPTQKQPAGVWPWALGFMAFAALVLGGVIIIIKNKDGTETKIEVPDGLGITIKDKGGKTLAKVEPKPEPPVRPAGTRALQFEPGNTVVATKVPHRATTELTIEVWVALQPSTGDNPETICSVPNGYLSVMGNQLNLYTFHGGSVTDKAFTPGQRMHVAGVNDGKQRRLYVDGKLLAKTDDAGILWPEASKPDFQGQLAMGSHKFAGTIEMVRISTTGRYDKEFTPPAKFTKDKDTFALYLFEEGVGDTLNDSSGNGYHAKITGAKWVSLDPDRKAAEWVIEQGGSVQCEGLPNEIKVIADLPKVSFTVTKVNLVNTPVGDAGLVHIKELKSLINLVLHSTKVTDAGLEHLKESKNLTTLDLTSTQVSDAGLVHIKELKNLIFLSLNGTPVGDAGLAHVKELKNLTQLNLQSTQVTDAGLVHIKELKTLGLINVSNTKVTNEGLDAFHAALPGCKIVHDGGVIEPKK